MSTAVTQGIRITVKSRFLPEQSGAGRFAFAYTVRIAVLKTPHGSMHGTYRMVAEDGRQFDAEIAPFPLTQPGAVN